ncbi:hypothetical protein [Roseateles saccharophilus]|uniref:Uncharacterized protein n=2 Tax=Roseateles saccharophilus TaxID=304 RepID=A0A4R3UJ92_ROSSA|nr:hypothetical protein [Roseateles saccharophilus]MDG0834955.1 hypothetical protein [Roseateles saccharophilus]TCU88370.1 hypothetical protein EV671_104041 [Roseateles saccharophilus]
MKQTFTSLLANIGWLSQHNCSIPGIAVEALDGGDIIRIRYDGYEVELRLTAFADDGKIKGRVFAVLTRHPMDMSSPLLGSFTLERDGRTDITCEPAGNVDYASYALQLVLNLVKAALLHQPALAAAES